MVLTTVSLSAGVIGAPKVHTPEWRPHSESVEGGSTEPVVKSTPSDQDDVAKATPDVGVLVRDWICGISGCLTGSETEAGCGGSRSREMQIPEAGCGGDRDGERESA
jgi:hypothetical protein